MTQWGLDNLFNPGKRHMDDEKRRLQSTREEIGDSSGGRRIDLERGTVSISLPKDPAAAAADDAASLEPALEAEDVPAVALANDEAEIEPEVVDEPAAAAEPEPAVAPVSAVDASPEPVTEPEPAPTTPPEPAVAAPRRRAVSANAWARRG